MGGGSAHCYLPFPRDKGIQGLLTSGFSQKDTVPGFPLYPLQTWLEEFEAVCLVVGTKNLHPFSVSVVRTADSDCNQTHDATWTWTGGRPLIGILFCVLNIATYKNWKRLGSGISCSNMLHLAQRLVRSSLFGSLGVSVR